MVLQTAAQGEEAEQRAREAAGDDASSAEDGCVEAALSTGIAWVASAAGASALHQHIRRASLFDSSVGMAAPSLEPRAAIAAALAKRAGVRCSEHVAVSALLVPRTGCGCGLTLSLIPTAECDRFPHRGLQPRGHARAADPSGALCGGAGV